VSLPEAPALCSYQQPFFILEFSENVPEIILCYRKLLKEVLKKEGKLHKDIFGKDTLPEVRKHLPEVSRKMRSQNSSEGIVTGYELDDRVLGVLVPAG
jgi:hypothetical protein